MISSSTISFYPFHTSVNKWQHLTISLPHEMPWTAWTYIDDISLLWSFLVNKKYVHYWFANEMCRHLHIPGSGIMIFYNLSYVWFVSPWILFERGYSGWNPPFFDWLIDWMIRYSLSNQIQSESIWVNIFCLCFPFDW